MSDNRSRWLHEVYEPARMQRAERREHFVTSSGIEVDPIYGEDVGFPGDYPFLRGIWPTMYRGRLWTMRQYSGFGSARETNKRFRYLLEAGQTGLSVAFDLPTQMGFVSDDELALMRADAEALLAGGADGVAFGILTKGGDVDLPSCRVLMRTVGDRTAVFHRAFDFTRKPEDALRVLIDLGVRRVLTSGHAQTALEGAELIARLLDFAAGRIEILPAAGIRSSNVTEILDRTGCTQVHGSFRKARENHDAIRSADGISLGAADGGCGGTDQAEIALVRRILDERASRASGPTANG